MENKEINKCNDYLDKEIAKMQNFFKYLVFSLMDEALMKPIKVYKNRTWSREREENRLKAIENFNINNKRLQLFCILADIDINSLFNTYNIKKIQKENITFKDKKKTRLIINKQVKS